MMHTEYKQCLVAFDFVFFASISSEYICSAIIRHMSCDSVSKGQLIVEEGER